MITFTYELSDPLGIHARPAGMIAKEAAKYSCDIRLQCGDNTADAKKVMAVMRLEARCGDSLVVTCTGDDEEVAAQQLGSLLSQHL